MNQPSLRTPEQEVVRKAIGSLDKYDYAIIAVGGIFFDSTTDLMVAFQKMQNKPEFPEGKNVGMLDARLPAGREVVRGAYPIIPYNVTNPEVLELIRVHNMMLEGA